MECDGIIEPKKLQNLALDSFCGLLHTALDIAEGYYPLPSEGSGEDFPHRVRRLLGLDREFFLPSVVADELVGCFSAQERLTSGVLSAFCRSKIGTLRKVNIASCPDTSEEAFRLLLQHPLLELTLSVSESGNTLVWWRHMDNLVGSPAAATLSSLSITGVKNDDAYVYDAEINSTFHWLKSLVSLNRLSLYRVYLSSRGAKALGQVAVQLPNLAILNVARTLIMDFEVCKSKVKALALSDLPVRDLSREPLFSHILKMESLVSLDISKQVQDVSSDQEMAQKLSRLPNLRYLDLSGHRIPPFDLDCFNPPHPRMSFLGLLATGACGRTEVNCDMVSGDANEQQILISLRTYSLRDMFIRHVLGKLWVFAEHGHLNALQEELVIAILPLYERKCLPDELVVFASACLWYLTWKEHKQKLSTYTKMKTFVTLVKFMEKDYFHSLNEQAIKNSVICLSHFLFPKEVEFMFTRALQLLIRLSQMRHNESVEGVAMRLLRDAMLVQSSLERKAITRNLGGIAVAVECIENKVERRKCDKTLESAWCFLWIVTDEAPENLNCAELINCGGLKIFVKCFKMIMAKLLEGQQYEDFQNVIEGMVGALGNIALFQCHRASLINSELLSTFWSVCENTKHRDVQHLITWLIANLVMEDDSLWEGVTPSKDHFLNMMEHIIDNWDIGRKLGFSYSSLTPVIVVVNCPNERVALWGVWALNHLCHTHSTRYFPMLRKKGGVEAVQNLLLRAKTDRVKRLASQVLALISDSEDIEEVMDVKRRKLSSQ